MTGSDVLVTLIACGSTLIVALAGYLLSWRVQRRLFDGYRDMLKAVLTTHQAPHAPLVGATMEETDRQVLTQEAKNGEPPHPQRPRMVL